MKIKGWIMLCMIGIILGNHDGTELIGKLRL